MVEGAGAAARPQTLDDLMMAMDVVDTLRHREKLVERELDEEGREAELIARLKEIYRQQGIEVTDEVLAEGVKALRDSRFVYTPPPPGLARTLFTLWVRRGRIGRRDHEAARVAERSRGQAKFLVIVVLAFMAVVSLYTPLAFDRIAQRWFSLPNFYFLWPVPTVTALVAAGLWVAINQRREVLPFVSAIGLFLLGYLGLVISNYPYLVPPSLTVWDTAAAPASQIFMLIGTLFLLPIILGYVIFIYWLFRGKVREGEAYH